MRCLSVAFCVLLSIALNAQGKMTLRKMEKTFDKAEIEYEGERGAWLLYTQDHILLVLSDAESNRMRIFTPIVEEDDTTPLQRERMLRANFQSALDAKYSLHDGFVVSVFTHPLRELSRKQLLDAIDQVVQLSETFGTTYSSTDLYFGEPRPEEQLKEEQKTEKRT